VWISNPAVTWVRRRAGEIAKSLKKKGDLDLRAPYSVEVVVRPAGESRRTPATIFPALPRGLMFPRLLPASRTLATLA